MTTLIRARIIHDDSPESPRTWWRVGHLVTWDERSASYEDDRGTQHTIRDVNGVGGRRLVHDHMRGESVIARADLPNGQHFRQGFIYMTRAECIAEYGSADDKARADALAYVRGEAELYTQWADGDAYGYTIERRTLCDLCERVYVARDDADDLSDVPDECPHCEVNEDDSCWGFYGTDVREWGADLDAEAMAALEAEADAYHIEYGYSRRIEAQWRASEAA